MTLSFIRILKIKMGKFLVLTAVIFLVFCSNMVNSEKQSSISISSENSLSKKTVNKGILRNSKLFPYFLLQFPNEPCTSSSGENGGICVSATECRRAGGTTIGTCAQGFGACCRYTKRCGPDGGDVIVRENSTDIKSFNQSTSCRFVLPKLRNICQVRLGFTEFKYGKGLSTGNCSQTRMEIRGGEGYQINLCGNISGQHLYFNYGNSERIYLNVADTESEEDVYLISVNYIRCNSRQAVPRHCSQYHTEVSGVIRSLNWPQQQLNNQDYTVCIASAFQERKGRMSHSSSQRIQWSTCQEESTNKIASNQKKFFISGKEDDAPVADPSQCNTDFIQIFGGNRQCGNRFVNETITSLPYLLRVRFDGGEIDEKGRGSASSGIVTVSKPREGCESLNTRETKCIGEPSSLKGKDLVKKNLIEEVAGIDDAGMCQCIKMLQSNRKGLKADIRNSGFCLAYKIITSDN